MRFYSGHRTGGRRVILVGGTDRWSAGVQRQLIDAPVPGLSELDAQTPELEVGVQVPGIAGGLKSLKGMKNLMVS